MKLGQTNVSYIYRGSLFTDDGNIGGEIDRRTNEDKKVIGRVGSVIKNKNISRKAERQMRAHENMTVLEVECSE